MTTVSDVKDLSTEPTYIIVYNDRMTYDDGYGRPGSPSTSTLHFLRHMQVTEEELKQWIIENDASYTKKTYRVLHATPVLIEKTVSISLNLSK